MRRCLSTVMPTTNLSTVMPGFMPGIHVLLRKLKKGVDARDERGHDKRGAYNYRSPSRSRLRCAFFPHRFFFAPDFSIALVSRRVMALSLIER